ncbi:MAG: DUF937 domain-containing protein, partial [Oscillospiraceae bacterium]
MSSSFSDLLLGALSNQGGFEAAGKTTNTDAGDVEKVASAALPLLLSALGENAKTPEGAKSLDKALDSHKTDSVKDIGAFFKNVDLDDGEKILGKIFGSQEQTAVSAIAKKSGVSQKSAGSILTALAPLLLSFLGGAKQKTNTGSDMLSSLFGSLLGGSSGGNDDGFGLDDIASLFTGKGSKPGKKKDDGFGLDDVADLFTGGGSKPGKK